MNLPIRYSELLTGKTCMRIKRNFFGRHFVVATVEVERTVFEFSLPEAPGKDRVRHKYTYWRDATITDFRVCVAEL